MEVEEEAVIEKRRGGVGAEERERSVDVTSLEHATGPADEEARAVGRGGRGGWGRGRGGGGGGEDGDEGGDGEAGGTMRRSDLTKSRTRASSESQLTGGSGGGCDCDGGGGGGSITGEEVAWGYGGTGGGVGMLA